MENSYLLSNCVYFRGGKEDLPVEETFQASSQRSSSPLVLSMHGSQSVKSPGTYSTPSETSHGQVSFTVLVELRSILSEYI